MIIEDRERERERERERCVRERDVMIIRLVLCFAFGVRVVVGYLIDLLLLVLYFVGFFLLLHTYLMLSSKMGHGEFAANSLGSSESFGCCLFIPIANYHDGKFNI
jgi:hypothetical protein